MAVLIAEAPRHARASGPVRPLIGAAAWDASGWVERVPAPASCDALPVRFSDAAAKVIGGSLALLCVVSAVILTMSFLAWWG